MNNNFYKKIFLILILVSLSFAAKTEEKKISSEHEYNFYTGNFDFSDDKQKSLLVGFQHQNENLMRETFLGNASPISECGRVSISAIHCLRKLLRNSATGTRTQVARVRAEYPNQLDYGGF